MYIYVYRVEIIVGLKAGK